MAKKQVPTDSQRTPTKQTPESPAVKGRKSRSTSTNACASREETKTVVVSSSTTESENDQVVESREAEEDEDAVAEETEERTPADEDDEEGPRSSKNAGKKSRQEGTRKKRAKKSKEDDGGEDEEEKAGATLYKFPMNRVSRIIKSEGSDLKISQESVFLLNRAAEKFLHVFCRDAYASSVLGDKNFTAYNHLSEVVSKRKRYQFLSEFIPEKLKAEDAIREAEKQANLNLHS